MTRRAACLLLALLVAILVVALPISGVQAQRPETIVIVVAPSSPLKNVSVEELRNVFLRIDNIAQGERVIPLNHPAKTPTRVLFDKLALDMNESQVSRYWIDRKLRGDTDAPRSVSPTALLKRVVGAVSGGISYVRLEEVDASVRVLTVNGKRPTEPGYPLRR
jgi:hypothetical protein